MLLYKVFICIKGHRKKVFQISQNASVIYWNQFQSESAPVYRQIQLYFKWSYAVGGENTCIQAQCVDLSIKLIPTQTNTHQSNSCCEPGLCVSGTGDCSRSMYALAGANSSQLIVSVTFFASGSKL